jgi:cyclic pyranopterin monophosphate synthase
MSDEPIPAVEPATTPDAGRGLTHVDESGQARMVDVSDKAVTRRRAAASGRVRLSREVVRLLRGEGPGELPKGDALGVAKIAGIMAAKRTSELIPLCHPLALSHVDVAFEVVDDGVEITATVTTTDRTGVEMEALTAVSVSALTVIDMIKAVDKHAVLEAVRVTGKAGGRSGSWGSYADVPRADEDTRPGAHEPGHPPIGQGPGA